ncbi:DUF6249 domain-containing protein [Frateuria hangzhouensis]|uniref:DUF6249 domain-containing protein n=1 Tax=Frateuria hangzhouensis TaxID=2995589 RepID=UPI002260FD00|nr:DUF6249 domain-containing protein [Frateuria sp. STR12]MCX7513890.1 hypothetical protein [Frateuria sp. STR12]
MQNTVIAIAGIFGLSLVLASIVLAFARLKIEQQRTLQRLIDRGVGSEQWPALAGLPHPASRDLRRGLLLLAVGLSWSAVTFFVGGKAWVLGFLPAALGLACLLLWKLDEHGR